MIDGRRVQRVRLYSCLPNAGRRVQRMRITYLPAECAFDMRTDAQIKKGNAARCLDAAAFLKWFSSDKVFQ